MTQPINSDAWLTAEFIPSAAYYSDNDCVEYVNEDTACVYERIDEFLTLIRDETGYNLIGFKMKGFRYIYETHLKSRVVLDHSSFVRMAQVIEAVCQQIGDDLWVDDRRGNAYKAAKKIAEKDRVELWELPEGLAA